jgi:GNAT superfamily N-acetyltransferase
VLVSLLFVRTAARRRGVGQALLNEAVLLAEAAGTDEVAVSVPPQLREAHRFFARLGFSPVSTRRVTTASALRRRLGTDPRDRVVDIRLRQRSLRDRARRAAANRRGMVAMHSQDPS